MVSGLFALVMAVSLGQGPAPAEAAWLTSVPADVDAVVHFKSLRQLRGEVGQMLEAMSPNLARNAGPMFDMQLDQAAQRFGETLIGSPVLGVLKLPQPGADGPPAFAVLVQSDDYEGLLKSLAGPNANFQLQPQTGGFDQFADQEGRTVYGLKGQGFVAFAYERPDLIRALAAKPEATLADKLPEPIRQKLLGGDAGGYISLLAVQNLYGDQIELGRQTLMGVIDQAAGQVQAGQVEQAREVYNAFFDAFKMSDALALNIDFDAKAFALSGLLTVKPDTDAAKVLAEGRVGAAEKLGNLPADATLYTYFNVNPESLAQLQSLSMSNLGPKPDSPEMKAALDALKQSGRQEAYGAMSFGGGIDVTNVSFPENPQATLAASDTMIGALRSSPTIKDVKIEKNVLAHKGFELSKATVTLDLAKIAASQPNNPGGEETLRKVFGGDTMTTWYGTDGKRVVSITAKTDEEAKAKLDTIVDDGQGIGQAAGFQAARALLPKEVSLIGLVNAQELVKQINQLLGTFAGQDFPEPAGMPKEPALFGGSIASTPEGYHFDLAIPSAVGPVFEQGFGPLMQGIQGQVNQ